MDTVQALMNVQYDSNWVVMSRDLSPDSEAKYVQRYQVPAEKDQGWVFIADGEMIGNYVRNYCEGVPDEDRQDYAQEACEMFLAELQEEIS